MRGEQKRALELFPCCLPIRKEKIMKQLVIRFVRSQVGAWDPLESGGSVASAIRPA